MFGNTVGSSAGADGGWALRLQYTACLQVAGNTKGTLLRVPLMQVTESELATTAKCQQRETAENHSDRAGLGNFGVDGCQ